MQRFRTLLALCLAFVMLATACSSSSSTTETDGGDEEAVATTEAPEEEPATTAAPDDGDDADDAAATTTVAEVTVPEGSTIGITDDSITISVLRSDTAALQEAGIIADNGDPVFDMEVFAQLANENGGAGGREIIVTSHLYPPGSTATDQQAACLGATEDDEAAIVVFIGGMAPETVLCAAEEHERLTYAWSGVLFQEIYDRSGGRLFNNAMSADRLLGGWVDTLNDRGDLGGTIGIIHQDQGDHTAAGDVIEASLAAAGLELAERVALPCEGRACTQYDIAVQRFQAAGVDTVFSLLGATVNPTFVGESEAAGFTPQFLASDFENQVIDTTARFMGDFAGTFDGAIGISAGLLQSEPDAYGEECNAQFNTVSDETYDFGHDGWNAVRQACFVIQRIVDAADASQDTYGTVNQATLIEFLENGEYQLGDSFGSFSPDKHDGADSVVLKTFSADCTCWSEIEGTRGDLSE